MRKGIEPWQRDFGRIHTPAMKNALIVMATAACNARRAPKPVLNAHLSDQRPQTGIDPWPASRIARFPAPIAAKASTMPANKRLGPDDHHGLEDRWKPAIQLDQEQAIAVRELDATAHLAPQHDQAAAARHFPLQVGWSTRTTKPKASTRSIAARPSWP